MDTIDIETTRWEQALVAAREHWSEYRPGFLDWLRSKEGKDLWNAFASEAMKVASRGRQHYSARTIIEVLRHHSAIRDGGPHFKINNNLAPDLSKLWGHTYPWAAGLFSRRSA